MARWQVLFSALLFFVLFSLIGGCTRTDNAPTTEQPSSTIAVPSPEIIVDYSKFLPPKLAKDFYPNGLTRNELIAAKSKATGKTGVLEKDETWDGVISITGDLQVRPGVTLNIKPGTIILVSALSDDQKTGSISEQDQFNPKKPARDAPYTQSRVEITIDGSLIARGTREAPIIITSDAVVPQTDDWLGIQFSPGSTGELERVIVEYDRIFGISSSNVTIKQAIIRNMMEAIVIMGQREELLSLNPTITQSYIYNVGQNAITVRSGKPTITNNIIRPRQDTDTLNLPGFEYGAIGVDHPANPSISYNFIEGGPSIPYKEYDIWGNYHEYLESGGLVFHGSIAPSTIAYNTFYGAGLNGLEIYPSLIKIEHNNFINNKTNLMVYESQYEPSDIWQKKLFDEGIIKPLRAQRIQATNNYWGSLWKNEIAASICDNGLVQIEFEPYKTGFIAEALPAWREFLW